VATASNATSRKDARSQRQDASKTLRIETPRWFMPLLAPARYKGAWGGRGSGKSHAFAEMLVEAHVLDPNRSTVCVREVQKSLSQSVKRLIEAKIEALGVGAYFEVQEAVIKSRKGDGRIIFQGMQNHTADSIKSLEGYDCAWVEEAQSLSQRSLDLLRPTIRKPGSELWFTWNPSQSTDPVDALLRGERPPPEAVVVGVNYEANPWFPEVLRVELEYDRKRDPDKFRHVWEGEYLRNSERRVFKNWRVEEFEAPRDAVIRFGADWGFAVDPTVLVRCYVEGRTLYVDFEAYGVGVEIVDTPALFLTVPGSETWPIVADSARPETIAHMRRHGFPKIMPAVKGPRSLEEGVEWLKSHDIVVHPRCVHLIDELTLYSYKADPLTGAVLPVLDDRDNHVIDALRYACEGARRVQAAKPVQLQPPQPVAHAWRR
jgi:phage terminase large subunit